MYAVLFKTVLQLREVFDRHVENILYIYYIHIYTRSSDIIVQYTWFDYNMMSPSGAGAFREIPT